MFKAKESYLVTFCWRRQDDDVDDEEEEEEVRKCVWRRVGVDDKVGGEAQRRRKIHAVDDRRRLRGPGS